MLQSLALSRGMGFEARNYNKKRLVQCLETADNREEALKASRTFHRFSEIPPELRNRIYNLYFESLGNIPPRFVVPPLCRASRQMRLETTELFFEQSTFVVYLRRVDGTRHPLLPYRHQARLHYHTEVARSNIPSLSFARIKHLHIELKAASNLAPMATWSIDLTSGRCVRGRPTHDQRYHEQSVQILVDLIMSREGLAKLEKSDLDKLEVAITDTYSRMCS